MLPRSSKVFLRLWASTVFHSLLFLRAMNPNERIAVPIDDPNADTEW